MTPGSWTVAIRRMPPPRRGQASTSIATARCSTVLCGRNRIQQTCQRGPSELPAWVAPLGGVPDAGWVVVVEHAVELVTAVAMRPPHRLEALESGQVAQPRLGRLRPGPVAAAVGVP